MNRFFILPIILALGLTLAACAPTGEATTTARGPITTEEIQSAGISGSAADAVNQLRPQWLRTRTGGGIRVYLDGGQMGRTSAALRGIAVQDVGRIERLSASEATTRFGSGDGGHPEGAIMVTSRR